LGNSQLVNDCNRGLTLTILNATTHSEVSSTNYDTWGSTADSDALAAALDAMSNGQIGLLTSCDAFEESLSADLRASASRLGLRRLASTSSVPDPVERRHPYAAIFYGSGSPVFAGSTSPQVVEIMQTPSANAPHAILVSWLIGDGFVGQGIPPQGSSCLGRRWLDQGDGTVLDCNTRLVWLRDASCFGGVTTWHTATTDVASLATDACGLTDGSSAGEWRLPTIAEFCSKGADGGLCPVAYYSTSFVDLRWPFGLNPKVSNSSGEGPWTPGDPFVGLLSSTYWSSTTDPSDSSKALAASLPNGLIVTGPKDSSNLVWPVRYGQ
jgi:hypothetical protein